jgi:hypothetical protein
MLSTTSAVTSTGTTYREPRLAFPCTRESVDGDADAAAFVGMRDAAQICGDAFAGLGETSMTRSAEVRHSSHLRRFRERRPIYTRNRVH